MGQLGDHPEKKKIIKDELKWTYSSTQTYPQSIKDSDVKSEDITILREENMSKIFYLKKKRLCNKGSKSKRHKISGLYTWLHKRISRKLEW